MNTHPRGLRHSRIPLVIVCGPPCSGKTTYVKSHAVAGDRIIDLDIIRFRLDPDYKLWDDVTDFNLLRRAIDDRNFQLRMLASAESGKAWFIVGAPRHGERVWWQNRLGGEIVLLNPGIEECKRRALVRGTPSAVVGIDRWVSESDWAWSEPTYKRPIGIDGYFERDEAMLDE